MAVIAAPGRDLPPSKYASPRPFTPAALSACRRSHLPPADFEPVILPGESLAKYKDRAPSRTRRLPAEPLRANPPQPLRRKRHPSAAAFIARCRNSTQRHAADRCGHAGTARRIRTKRAAAPEPVSRSFPSKPPRKLEMPPAHEPEIARRTRGRTRRADARSRRSPSAPTAWPTFPTTKSPRSPSSSPKPGTKKPPPKPKPMNKSARSTKNVRSGAGKRRGNRRVRRRKRSTGAAEQQEHDRHEPDVTPTKWTTKSASTPVALEAATKRRPDPRLNAGAMQASLNPRPPRTFSPTRSPARSP